MMALCAINIGSTTEQLNNWSEYNRAFNKYND